MLASLAVRNGVFFSVGDFETFAAAEPWHVLVTETDDAVLLEKWREHADVLSMRAVWCAPRRIPALVEGARAVARGRGLATVMSPLVADDLAAPYRRAGMEPLLRVLVLRRELHGSDALTCEHDPPAGIEIGTGSPLDARELLELDRVCFEPLWAYDRPLMERYITQDRTIVARTRDGARIVGYAMAGRVGEEGTIGRLAVDPAWRGRGLGGALLAEAVRTQAASGRAYVTLTTQTDNEVAQRLYLRQGFKCLRGQLVGLTIGA